MSEGRNALLHLCFHRVKVQFMSYEILGMCKKYYNMRGVRSVCAMVWGQK